MVEEAGCCYRGRSFPVVESTAHTHFAVLVVVDVVDVVDAVDALLHSS